MGLFTEDNPLVCDVRVELKDGVHMRPAARLSELCLNAGGSVSVLITRGEIQAHGESILDLIGLFAPQGATVTVTLTGPEEAARALLEQIKAVLAMPAWE